MYTKTLLHHNIYLPLMTSWNEVVNSAIESGAVVSVQSEGRVSCYAEGKLILTFLGEKAPSER